jgi:hypothetical protein
MRKWIPYTRIEYLIAAALLLIIAARWFRPQLRQWEETFFEDIGLGGPVRFVILVPLFLYVVYRMHQRAALEGQPAVRWQVGALAAGGLLGAFAWAYWLTRS